MRTWKEMAADDGLWASLGGRSVVLMLDFDGTLAPFVPDPDEARPYPGVRAVLDELADLGCRLVFVTGRDCRRLPGFLGLAHPPEVWGSHGGERLLPDGTVQALHLSPSRARGLEWVAEQTARAGYADALERKPGGLAFHVRGLPREERRPTLMAVRSDWGPVALEHGLKLRDFDGGVELRVPDVHKGQAVAAVLREAGAGAAAFYLGDDDTDEDAFAAIRGRGAGILVRAEARDSRAAYLLRPPGELLEFLGRIAASLRPE